MKWLALAGRQPWRRDEQWLRCPVRVERFGRRSGVNMECSGSRMALDASLLGYDKAWRPSTAAGKWQMSKPMSRSWRQRSLQPAPSFDPGAMLNTEPLIRR
jgi:hypothetical protein